MEAGADTNLNANYAFKITDGATTFMQTFTGSSSAVNVQHLNNTDAAIEAYVLANLYNKNCSNWFQR